MSEAMQELLDQGFTKIHVTEGDGQSFQIFMAKKFGKSYAYMIVNCADDGEVLDMVGMANGKVFQGVPSS